KLALAGWDPSIPGGYALPGVPNAKAATASRSFEEALVARRAAELERTTGLPGGEIFERARFLAPQGRAEEALRAIAELGRKQPRSQLVADARTLAHEIALDRAIALAADENPKRNLVAAGRALTALGKEPFDFPVGAAEIARAGVLALQGAK